MATCTVTFTSQDSQGNPVEGDVFVFKLLQWGTATDAPIHTRRREKADPTDAAGTSSIDLWVNGDSEKESVYRVLYPNKESADFIIPSGATTKDLSDLVINHAPDPVDGQAANLFDAKADKNASNITSVLAALWRTALELGSAALKGVTGIDSTAVTGTAGTTGNLSIWNGDGDLVDGGIASSDVLLDADIGVTVQAYNAGLADIAGLTPTNESIIKGNGTNWVAATNFRVNAGTTGTGFEVGAGATANGENGVAIGSGATASDEGSVSIGTGASSTGTFCFAIGASAVASDDGSIAIGSQANSSGPTSLAIGFQSISSADGSVAIGTNANASSLGAYAMGINSTASSEYSIASGRRAKAIHSGSRVVSDSQNADVSSTTTDQYTARFQNGYKFKGGLAAFEGGASFGDATTQSTTRANLGVTIYGQLYFSATAATTIAVAGTYVKLAGTTTSDSLNGITMPQNNRLQNNSGSTRVFQAMARADIIDGSGNKNIAIKLAKNGVLIDATESNGETTNNVAAHTTINWIVSLATGEYVEIWATNKSDTSSITAQHGHLFLKAID